MSLYEAEGVVVRLEGENALIQANRQSSCGGCSKNSSSCGTASLLGFFERRAPLYKVRNDIGAQPGERVVIGLPQDALLKGAAAIYLPALLLLVAGAIGGSLLGNTPASREGYSVIGAVAGLAAGYLWSCRQSAHMNANGAYRPEVLSRTPNLFVVNSYGDRQ